MGRRQTAVERTRERIVAATFELHASIGPSRTTIRAIAERSGVQRRTVYAHFPDIESLYEACTVHGIRSTAMPEPGGWRSIDDPNHRLRHGLAEMFAWYRANEQMLGNVLFDVDPNAPAPTSPDAFDLRMGALLDALLDGLTIEPDGSPTEPHDRPTEPDGSPTEPDRRPILEAVVAHALDFTTWRSLVRGGLADDQVVTVLMGLVGNARERRDPADRPREPAGEVAHRPSRRALRAET